MTFDSCFSNQQQPSRQLLTPRLDSSPAFSAHFPNGTLPLPLPPPLTSNSANGSAVHLTDEDAERHAMSPHPDASYTLRPLGKQSHSCARSYASAHRRSGGYGPGFGAAAVPQSLSGPAAPAPTLEAAVANSSVFNAMFDTSNRPTLERISQSFTQGSSSQQSQALSDVYSSAGSLPFYPSAPHTQGPMLQPSQEFSMSPPLLSLLDGFSTARASADAANAHRLLPNPALFFGPQFPTPGSATDLSDIVQRLSQSRTNDLRSTDIVSVDGRSEASFASRARRLPLLGQLSETDERALELPSTSLHAFMTPTSNPMNSLSETISNTILRRTAKQGTVSAANLSELADRFRSIEVPRAAVGIEKAVLEGTFGRVLVGSVDQRQSDGQLANGSDLDRVRSLGRSKRARPFRAPLAPPSPATSRTSAADTSQDGARTIRVLIKTVSGKYFLHNL